MIVFSAGNVPVFFFFANIVCLGMVLKCKFLNKIEYASFKRFVNSTNLLKFTQYPYNIRKKSTSKISVNPDDNTLQIHTNNINLSPLFYNWVY